MFKPGPSHAQPQRWKQSVPWKHAVFLVLLVLSAACRAKNPARTNAFLLESEEVDFQAATDQVVQALAVEIQAADFLQEGYPLAGFVTTSPDPADPGVERMACTVESPAPPDAETCILINRAGDFVRVKPITWQSAAFFMYRIYVSPPSLSNRIDPTRDFVAIDVYLMQEPGLFQDVDQAIYDAADHLGAKPFQP
jgi:hypothetical protein